MAIAQNMCNSPIVLLQYPQDKNRRFGSQVFKKGFARKQSAELLFDYTVAVSVLRP